MKKEKILQAKEKFLALKEEHENISKEREKKYQSMEDRERAKEKTLTQKMEQVTRQEKEFEQTKAELTQKLEVIELKKSELEKMQSKRVQELSAIANLKPEEAKNQLMQAMKDEARTDAMQYIKQIEASYDIIVLDPPAFAKHRDARHKAVQGYKRLNAHAMKYIKSGGILFTFSCSQVVDKELFYNTIVAASIESGRQVRILEQLHQPADHPIHAFHPEGEYLKGLVLEVL
jgi:hypothetical protein